MKNIESQNKRILDHLYAGKGISSMLAFKMYGCTRLASRIFDLKNKGHNITGEMVEHNGSRFKLYRLEK